MTRYAKRVDNNASEIVQALRDAGALVEVIHEPVYLRVWAGEKSCSSCNKSLPLEMFNKDKSKKDGLSSSCSDCNKERSKKWREENRERFLLSMRNWYQENKEHACAANRKWASENVDLMRKYGREWASRNKEYTLMQVHKRRAKKREVGGKLSVGLKEKLYKLQKGKCACCGANLDGVFHMDHIVPLALGGANIDSNIQLLRPACNSSKNAKHPIEYMQSKGYLL